MKSVYIGVCVDKVFFLVLFFSLVLPVPRSSESFNARLLIRSFEFSGAKVIYNAQQGTCTNLLLLSHTLLC